MQIINNHIYCLMTFVNSPRPKINWILISSFLVDRKLLFSEEKKSCSVHLVELQITK